MTYKLIVEDRAYEDIVQGIIYYVKISKKLTIQFKKEIKEKINEVNDYPKHFADRYRNVRIALTKKFPFAIHFTIIGNVVYVLRIMHTKRFYV